MSAEAMVVFWAVVLARFVVPLFIPRFPLPAIIAALVLDAVDQTVFQAFGYDPPGYQGYDKAMDVYYLSIAYISTLRNWTNSTALRVGRFLFFYRLIGVLTFEMLQLRWMLLVFANVFEYFFIAYEAVRTRWDPAPRSSGFWLATMAAIWVGVKLPQEWWIHVAQLDFTDALSDWPWFGPAIAVAAAIAAGVVWFVVRPRLAPPAWPPRLAAGALPEEMDEAEERAAWLSTHGRVRSVDTVEKIVLVGLISVIFGQVLPGLRSTELQLFVAIAVLVVINVAWSLFAARRAMTLESAWAVAVARLSLNLLLVFGFDWLLGERSGDLNLVHTMFFLSLLSLLVVLHDRYRPVAGIRFAAERSTI